MNVSGDGGVHRGTCPRPGEDSASIFATLSGALPKNQNHSQCSVGSTKACKEEEEERLIVEDALRRLPQLAAFPLPSMSPWASSHVNDTPVENSSFYSRQGTSYTLAADEEALLLQELVNITAGAAPFVSTAAQEEHAAGGLEKRPGEAASLLGSRETGIRVPAATDTANGDCASSAPKVSASEPAATSPAASSAHSSTHTGKGASSSKRRRAVASPTSSKTAVLKEEQDILDAIFAAVDGQQSSVSGDLLGETSSAAAAEAPATSADSDEEIDEVDLVLEQAKQLTSSTVLCETQRGELILHVHEHMALRSKLADLRKTAGEPTCVAVAEPFDISARAPTHASTASPAARTPSQSLSCAMGTSLGVVVLFDRRWTVLGICGSVEASVVNARGAVVSLSLCTSTAALVGVDETCDGRTAATGHARGTFVLWSLHTFSPLRVVSDESRVPVLRVMHLHRDPTRILVLDSSGAVRFFQFWKVMAKYMLRATSVTSALVAAPISDIDTLPCPSSFYMANLTTLKQHMPCSNGEESDGDVSAPWLCAPPPLPPATATAAGISRTTWPAIAGKHFVAAVSNDAVLVYVVETGLQGTVTGVARHSHPPSSALSNELVRFVVMELGTSTPRLLLCISWNTEVELLLVNLRLPEPSGSRKTAAAEPMLEGLERLALLRVSAPLVQMVPLAGCSVLLCDQNSDAQLMDASVAVMVERHRFGSLEYVGFAGRLCGVKYHGTAASNRAAALLMGKEHAYGISLRSWRERLSSLLARRKYTQALDLAKGFAEEVALSTVGFSSNAANCRRELHQFMERILIAYVESRLAALPRTEATGKSSGGPPKQSAGNSGPICGAECLLDVLQQIASYCSAVDGLNLLYGPVALALQQRGLLSHLLYVLEQCMRHGIITYMPETLIERFIHLFLDDAELDAVEVALGMRPRAPQDGKEARGDVLDAGQVADSAAKISGRDRVELALMFLDSGAPTLLRLAQEHGLVRLTVTILSLRQQRYVDALAYALDEEQKADDGLHGSDRGTDVCASRVLACPNLFGSPDAASVAVDFVECTLKGVSLLPGASLAIGEQRPAKRAILEYLLRTAPSDGRNAHSSAVGGGVHNLLRFLRRQPEHAMRVLLFALSDEGPCSPWGGADGLSRTQFVSSVYFILTGGSRTRPRHATESDLLSASGQRQGPLDLFRIDDDSLNRLPALRTLKATELAQRPFPPYIAVHTFLAGAAIFNELFLSTDAGELASDEPDRPPVRLDVWLDLVIQDVLFAFQSAERAEERRELQEHLLRVLAPDLLPPYRVAVFQSDFTRLRMARCLAALFCKEQRYAEAIACYTDPLQNCVDAHLQQDVFKMLRDEMQHLQDMRTQTMNRAQQESSQSQRLENSARDSDRDAASLMGGSATSEVGGGFDDIVEQHFSKESSLISPTVTATTTAPIDAAIKALQRAVMSQVELLVRIDATALAQFIFDYLPSNQREVINLLRGSSAAFMDYLDELVTQGDQAVANDMSLQNTYIELLCAHAPRRVYSYLQEKGNRVTYDVQLALRAVRKHRIADAAVYLLEKAMMIEDAMTVMLRAVRELLGALREEVLTRVTTGAEAAAEAQGDQDRDGSSPPLFTSTPGTEAGEAATQRGCRRRSTRGKDAPPLTFELATLDSATELWRFVGIGEELCGRHQAERVTGGSSTTDAAAPLAAVSSRTFSSATHAFPGGSPQHPEYWFRLLDVFMVPRRLLCEMMTQDDRLHALDTAPVPARPFASSDPTGMSNELDAAAHIAMASHAGAAAASLAHPLSAAGPPQHLASLTTPLSRGQRRCVEALVAVYTQYTSSILQSMMRSLDIAVVVDKVVQDNKDGTFRALKPILLDMMATLSFDLEASRLCKLATERDVILLGRELYQMLNRSVVPQSDCCAFCHIHLCKPPLPQPAGDEVGAAAAVDLVPLAVSVYTCGHAFHTVCAAQAMGSRQGCGICMRSRCSSGKPGGSEVCGNASGASAAWPSTSGGAAADRAGHRDHADPVTTVVMRAAERTIDVARMQRRVRQTKMKMDHPEDLYSVLKSLLAWDTTASDSSLGKAGPGVTRDRSGNCVLAPSPSVPAVVGQVHDPVTGGVTTTQDKVLDTLTDAEILELFGGA
ncbi:Region in Clathrin and VPS [Leishmania donovani]|uniref:Region_in_Clathrin_and_VPS_putative/Pfam:PF00637 n=1 Tax=Leishmania donovani TaxID=5661 RepID=A0A6J8FTU3_LEIDO|nr:Region in Clathrin and VPS [Leishmania donovani]VDZ49708.1 Region_in_Clathrin_and_VPS_putative/Pfam:PF00637 [Leishmania donovani]